MIKCIALTLLGSVAVVPAFAGQAPFGPQTPFVPTGATTPLKLSDLASSLAFTPQMFNATAGQGSDDSAAINAAIARSVKIYGASNGPNAGHVILPYPPSGYYNVCASPVNLPGGASAFHMEGLAGGGSAIRVLPGCSSPPANVVYGTANSGTFSQSRVTLSNITIDGSCLAKYPLQLDYAVGFNMDHSVVRNAAPAAKNTLTVTSGAAIGATSISVSGTAPGIGDALPGANFYPGTVVTSYAAGAMGISTPTIAAFGTNDTFVSVSGADVYVKNGYQNNFDITTQFENIDTAIAKSALTLTAAASSGATSISVSGTAPTVGDGLTGTGFASGTTVTSYSAGTMGISIATTAALSIGNTVTPTYNQCYTKASDVPPFNIRYDGTDSWIDAPAINASFANYYNEAGGDNHYHQAHGWGYQIGSYGSTISMAPLFTYISNGTIDINGAVSDHATYGAVFLHNNAFANQSTVANMIVVGNSTANGVVLDTLVVGAMVHDNQLRSVITPANGIVQLGTQGAGTMFYNNNGATLNSVYAGNATKAIDQGAFGKFSGFTSIGSAAMPLQTKSASYTESFYDDTLKVDATAGTSTQSLLQCSTQANQVKTYVKSDASANAVVITVFSGDKILTSSGLVTTLSLSSQASFATIKCDGGTTWLIVSKG